ncbi:MAG: DUF2938 domain-containing protein [Nitrospiraceae bacterium]
MGIENSYIGGAVVVGIGAVLIMDLWNLFLRHAFNIASLNFCLVGRWLSHMRTGTFTHANIAAAQKRPVECAIGWIAHYLIGIAFAVLLVMLTSGSWLESPSLLPALLVGIGTVPIPYFIVQPALGFGIAAAKTPNPTQARLKSLITHTVFGVGLYLAAFPVSYVVHLYA